MYFLNTIKIETVLFLDIETVPNWETFEQAPENVQKEWIYKYKFRPDAPKTADQNHADNSNFESTEKMLDAKCLRYYSDLWNKEAGLKAEFSRIVCISVGYMYQGNFHMKSYTNENEGLLLSEFKNDTIAFCDYAKEPRLCAHFGKGFDYPFIARRMLINRIQLPAILDTAHLKPWEQKNLDTWELWKMGSMEGAGLPALCMAFGLDTPKDDLDGSMVCAAYYRGEIRRIAIYCEKDIFALVNVFKAFRFEEPLTEDKIKMPEDVE